MNGITWTALRFNALDLAALHDLLKLRVDVFVVEQRCAYAELDGADPDAVHVLGREAGGALVAYARILPPDAHGLPHIGRVVVHPEHRGRGLAKAVMQACFAELERTRGDRRNALSAQAHLTALYASLGYEATSGIYDWDGIPHVDMVLNAPG